MEENDWESRLEAVREARELVLNKYQPLAGAAQIIRELPFSEKVPVEIKPIKSSLLTRVTYAIHKLLNGH